MRSKSTADRRRSSTKVFAPEANVSIDLRGLRPKRNRYIFLRSCTQFQTPTYTWYVTQCDAFSAYRYDTFQSLPASHPFLAFGTLIPTRAEPPKSTLDVYCAQKGGGGATGRSHGWRQNIILSSFARHILPKTVSSAARRSLQSHC